MSTATTDLQQPTFRIESDSIGEVRVPGTPLWGAQTQRSLEHFSIGKALITREMISAYAILKKSAANANRAGGRLDDDHHELIVRTCDEILANSHQGHCQLKTLRDILNWERCGSCGRLGHSHFPPGRE
jgi:fumarate hydratase class II